MDQETSVRFVSQLVKSIQSLCNGYVDFASSIEVIGHIHLYIDHSKRLDYVLTEEVSKSVSEGSTVFESHSYHSQCPSAAADPPATYSSKLSRQKSHCRDACQVPLATVSAMTSVSQMDRQALSEVTDEHLMSPVDLLPSADVGAAREDSAMTPCFVQEASSDRKRKTAHRPKSPSFKRQALHQPAEPVPALAQFAHDFDIVEIKEEPDDEPNVVFSDSSMLLAGQDAQNPDYKLVMDGLGHAEFADLTQSPNLKHADSSYSYIPPPSASMTASSFDLNESKMSTEGTPVSPDHRLRLGKCEDTWQPSSHVMDRVPVRGFKTNCQKRCSVCNVMGVRRDSRFCCIVCPEKPGLCRKKDCFRVYHQWKGISVDPDSSKWVVVSLKS